jgi:hypothetical protein
MPQVKWILMSENNDDRISNSGVSIASSEVSKPSRQSNRATKLLAKRVVQPTRPSLKLKSQKTQVNTPNQMAGSDSEPVSKVVSKKRELKYEVKQIQKASSFEDQKLSLLIPSPLKITIRTQP